MMRSGPLCGVPHMVRLSKRSLLLFLIFFFFSCVQLMLSVPGRGILWPAAHLHPMLRSGLFPARLPWDLGRQLLPITGVPSDCWLSTYLVITVTWLLGFRAGDKSARRRPSVEELSAETLVPRRWRQEKRKRPARLGWLPWLCVSTGLAHANLWDGWGRGG